MEKIPETRLEQELEELEKTRDEERKELKIQKIEKKTKEKDEQMERLKEEKEKKKIIEDIEEAEMREKVKKEKPRAGFFKKLKEKIVTKRISAEKFEKLFWNLEVVLLENNVAVEVIDKIKEDLKKELVDTPIPRGKVLPKIENSLKNSIESLFDVEKINLLSNIRKKKEKGEPYVICFVGVNGSGKTTTIAKLANLFKKEGLLPVIAAGDTFRAAAIDQLEEHAKKVGVKVIKHDYGADSAAVAFDAIKYAKAKAMDVVLIDTAGRQHSNINLMEELAKVIRVSKPDITIFIGESITGNDCVEQAKEFSKVTNVNGIILSKADVDDKGGAAISISYVTKKPILYLGTGQGYDDLTEFDSRLIVKSLGLEG
ncbi:signal recognition particle-docking protein FtsY [Candidatus Woesearchaeota archaeon]|nr:MAG: signal recognition particle-docking protein FtsY [Candidatus Woesearchaeota archaeon]